MSDLMVSEAAAADAIDICKVGSGPKWGVRIGASALYDQFHDIDEANACRDALRAEVIASVREALNPVIESFNLIVSAQSRGFGADYMKGVAENALRCKIGVDVS